MKKQQPQDKPFDLSVVWLPFKNLEKLDELYPPSNKNERTIPVLMVCIYNVEQLASAIAKNLKGSADNRSEGNDEG